MKQRFLIEIQSFSDIITNSSSELFMVNSNKIKTSLEDFVKFLDDAAKEQLAKCEKLYDKLGWKKFYEEMDYNEIELGSGMGYDLEVSQLSKTDAKYNLQDALKYNENQNPVPYKEEDIDKLVEENTYILVDIDRDRRYTIDILVKMFDAIELPL